MKISRNGRIWVGVVIWVAVAIMLITRGYFYAWHRIDSTTVQIITLVLAVVLGAAKGHFVIGKSAARNAAFIARRPEKDWFWMCFHPIMYILIPVMILFGLGLRKLALVSYPALVFGVYVGIGVGLLVATRRLLKISN